jgi:hypothetical protein
VKPILVTDAGFQSPWFDAVEQMGWHYVGRVRHRTRFLRDGEWVSVAKLHSLTDGSARNLGHLPFPKERPKARRLVLAAKPIAKGRQRINHFGRKGKTATDRRYRKGQREPWLLATSLTSRPKKVVETYAMRMQIEQNYRDTKNHRWGWQLSLSGSKSNARLEMLLLVATLAMLAVLAVGAVAESQGHDRRYQANTIRNTRVLSWFFVGCRILKSGDSFLDRARFAFGLSLIQRQVRSIASPA